MRHTIHPRPQYLADALDRARDLVSTPPPRACPDCPASDSRRAAVSADVAELVRLLRSETELTQRLDHGVDRLTRALGLPPGGADFDTLVSSVSDLVARREIHLRLIHDLSQSAPLPDELAGWEGARAALLAEIGTLRSRLAEIGRDDPPSGPCTGQYVPGMPCRPHAGCGRSGCASADRTESEREADRSARLRLEEILGPGTPAQQLGSLTELARVVDRRLFGPPLSSEERASLARLLSLVPDDRRPPALR